MTLQSIMKMSLQVIRSLNRLK